MKIKEARQAAGWSIAQLVKELEIPRGTYEKWELGISKPPVWAEKLIIAEIQRRTPDPYEPTDIEDLKKQYEAGKELSNQGYNEFEAIDRITYYELNKQQEQLFMLGFQGAKVDFIIGTHYRIGKPKFYKLDNWYKPSFNHAAEKFEKGISVINHEWLESYRGQIFTAFQSEEEPTIYKLHGFIIGFGGDNEPLIFPTSTAIKTDLTIQEIKF